MALLIPWVLPWLGRGTIPLDVLWRPASETVDSLIFWEIRIPRVLLAFFAGVGLSLGGVVFQALFRNPLATPFTLGVAGGASLGVTLWVFLGFELVFFGVAGTSMAAWVGALVSIAFVYGAARASGRMSSNTMLLGGVAMSFFFSSIILLIQYLGDASNAFRILHWLMGDLSRASYDDVLRVFPFVLIGVVTTLWHVRELDLISVDDELAEIRGVEVVRVRALLFVVISLMLAGIVTACGPIGFVGIMAPHICRLLVGVSHRVLVVASLSFGGAFLAMCDTVARSLSESAEVPVGIVT
ncbi:MAG: FecCD family ABC transporter permease, partial [Verrucomicrobiales bacterium]